MSKTAEKISCLLCDFNCNKQSNYNKHLLTSKHIFRTELNEKNQQKTEIFECVICDFICNKQSNYKSHLLTKKHINRDSGIINNEFSCKNCKKIYKARNSLWYHEQKCNSNENITISISENNTSLNNILQDNEDFKKLILEIVKNNTELQKQNNEFQKQNCDLQKQMFELCKNTSTINSNNNHSHNKTFNLQFFLNEQCKDAMNISDFANSFELELSDLESVGDLGYVEGITKIFLDKLNSMDIYKRPIHCSDAKREILYVKDDNKWEREERNNPKIRYAIKTISFRNMKLAVLWSETYPESKDCDSRVNERYMKLIKESTGGSGEIIENENKIIRRIAKEIVIDKK